MDRALVLGKTLFLLVVFKMIAQNIALQRWLEQLQFLIEFSVMYREIFANKFVRQFIFHTFLFLKAIGN